MTPVKAALVATALSVASVLALPAHADAVAETGPNGGLLRESGEHHIELLVKGQTLTVHLLDHKNKPSAESGVTGKATVTAAGATETVALTAKANGVFVGTGKFAATGPLKVDIVLTPPGEAPLAASFDVTR